MEPEFVHLRVHTEFSIHDGLPTIPDLLTQTAKLGMPALAVTDLCNLYAVIKFYKESLQAGVKPLIGVDVWVAGDDKEPATRLTLLCQTNEGYHNLIKLISKSFLEGQQTDRPVVEKTWLTSLSNGLIALSGAEEGDIGLALLARDKRAIKQRVKYWTHLFPNRFYLEVKRIGRPQENEYIAAAVKLAEANQLPVVATNDVRFLARSDFEAHEARVCIQSGVTLDDPHRERSYTDQQYFRSTQEMQTLFADMPEALVNTVELAKRCNVTFALGNNLLPHFDVPAGYTTESWLQDRVVKGLAARLPALLDSQAPDYADKCAIYQKRLDHELSVINEMGFAGYFLIVADFTQWSKENGIPVGPGRGSGPGSLVAFILNITGLDPIALDLLFERFLNPERVSMPDFDIDFCMDGRDRVIEYVMNRHGHDSVSQIITYGTMAAKAVVRDVGRVLGLGYGFVDKIAKLIPFELGMTLDKALVQEPLLRERYEQEEDVKTLIDLALKLEGTTRNVGKHAGGIVIAPGKLTDFVPLYCEPNEPEHPVTQFDKDDVESVGLVKFDFLGLKTLTIIDKALRSINESNALGHQAPVDITRIALDDASTFKLLKQCQSMAVFQLESPGMRDLIKRLQPDCFEDLVALVALFRPGPLQSGMVDDFINRKHGRAKVVYPHPKLEPVLRPTYGVILYQEQVMQIAQVLAGYTLGSADILRRAMGKKKPEEMAKQREIFCKGAVSLNVPFELANQIFDLMEKFAGYGFNKSHSASYALIAYQTAWLKTHYPAAFMAAVLSSDMDKTEKIIIYLDECQALKLQLSPPDINNCVYEFYVVDHQHIQYGLGAIKGMGQAAIENILEARNEGGLFKNLYDFCQRVDLRKVNRRSLEALIKAGCFDSLGTHRASLMASLDNALQHAEQVLHNQTYGQHDLLGMASNDASPPPSYVKAPAWRDDVQLQGEKETLGFYLTGHPLRRYLNELSHFTTCRIAELHPGTHTQVRIAGIVTGVRNRQTKRGDRIGIVTIDDGTTQIEAVCFSDCYQKFRSLLVADAMLVIEGEVSMDEFNNRPRLVARDIYTLDHAREKFGKALYIHFKGSRPLDPAALQQILSAHSGGHCHVVIRTHQDNVQTDVRLGNKWRVKPTGQLLTRLHEQLQADLIEVGY